MAPTSTPSDRQQSPVRALYREISSPDPLGDSSLEELASIPVTRCRSGASNRASGEASRRRESNNIDVWVPVSPSKMVAEQNLSPWKIKVTVEAEPEDATDDAPNPRTRTVTNTMKVPLRDEDSQTTRKGGARRRTSSSRKSVSPSRTRVTRSRRQSVTDLTIAPLGDDAEEDEWAVKPKSPRKRRNSKSQTTQKALSVSTESKSGTFEIREDEGSANLDPHVVRDSIEDGSPELKEVDLNEIAMRTRQGATKPKDSAVEEHKKNMRKVSASSAISYPTPSPTVSEHGNSDGRNQTHDAGNQEHDFGLDTVMESEGFTMIDLNSLPSVRHMTQNTDHPTISEHTDDDVEHSSHATTNETEGTTADAPSIQVTGNDANASSELPSSPPDSVTGSKKTYCIGHLQLPSSTNVQRHRLVTPMPIDKIPYSSPNLPSPPPAPASISKERSPVHSDQAVQAGSALQGAVTPEYLASDDRRALPGRQDNEEETLFGGFSSGTRRELRAELRFGEELARKQLQKQRQRLPESRPAHLQIWRGETTVQHTPPVSVATKGLSKEQSSDRDETIPEEDMVALYTNKLGPRVQKGRDESKGQAGRNEAVIVASNDQREAEEEEEGDETMGDIWLAEARQTPSSPKESVSDCNQPQETAPHRPRRMLIPSPWKRGQQIETSHVSDESISGLFWQQRSANASSGRFGEAIVANPERAPKSVRFDRRRSGEFDVVTLTPKPTRRLSPRTEQDIEETQDDDFNAENAGVRWRNAEDVIEEETNQLEADGRIDESLMKQRDDDDDAGTTCLYETNLDAVQELSSSPEIRSKEKQASGFDHDSTYSSYSEESTVEGYRQRTSLSPSKERPNTPRSAMKGGRSSFGTALTFDGSDELNTRKVMWAKKSKCMNEDWEESTRSVMSSQESTLEEMSAKSSRPAIQGTEASFEVQPQVPQQVQSNKGWFGWFARDSEAASSKEETASNWQAATQANAVHDLDGSNDLSSEQSYHDEESSSSYAPMTAPVSADTTLKEARSHHKETDHKTSRSTAKPPPYLLPPSYPSDTKRDPSVLLSTAGTFTNTHFRTLHILYRKSSKSRFHGPSYPDEIRPTILDLVHNKWKLEVDESTTMGEDGFFEFMFGQTEARVLERFMREVEFAYKECDEEVVWGWSAVELAERLGRIAIGEKVREEEKAVDGILRSAKKIR